MVTKTKKTAKPEKKASKSAETFITDRLGKSLSAGAKKAVNKGKK